MRPDRCPACHGTDCPGCDPDHFADRPLPRVPYAIREQERRRRRTWKEREAMYDRLGETPADHPRGS